MKLFGLEINDILVSFVLTLIVSGAITYFCHMRLKNIENAVTKQNQVLSSFITNVKNEINPNDFSISSADSSSVAPQLATPFALGSATPFALGSAATLASEEAIKSVAALEDKNALIEVSDDDSDDSSSDESDSETEDDEEDNQPERLEMNLGNFFEINQDDIKIIDLICIPQQKYSNDSTIDNSTSKIIEIFDSNTSDTDSDDESEEEIIVKKISEPIVPVQIPMQTSMKENSQAPEQIEVKVVSIEPTEVLPEDLDASNFIKKIHTTHEEGETKLEKMKIEDLRHLAVTKGIGSKDEVKKIKKPELIALLEKV
jgi:hypothetical protein